MGSGDLTTDGDGGLSRRSLVLGAVGLGGLAALGQVAFAPEVSAATELGSAATELAMVTIATPSRSLFLDNEQILGRYLVTAVEIANDIIGDPDAEFYGFMDGGWWRSPETQYKHNARIMEHVATLAWFYSNQRSWNQDLYNNPHLYARLEAAIAYYTSLQLDDDSYPNNDDLTSSLAATTFGIVAQADTYESLRKMPNTPAEPRTQLRESIDRAVRWFMNPSAAHWTPPIPVFNQVVAGLVGAQRALQVLTYNWPTTQAAINERITYLCAHGQAPAGFFHEPYGVDYGYNFTVAMPDLAWLYTQTQHPDLVPLVTRYVEFMRYAVLPEPGTGGLWHIPALHSRNGATSLDRPASDVLDDGALAKAFLPVVPNIALFLPTKEEKTTARLAFTNSPNPIPLLNKPDTSPRKWMYGPIAPEGPTNAARAAVESNLPVLMSERFSKLEDGSKNDQYLFVRRPSYYVVSVFGTWMTGHNSTRQLGTLWHPTLGTILVGTNAEKNGEGWETIGPGGAFSTRHSGSTSQYFDSRTSAQDHLIDKAAVRQKTALFAQRTQSLAGQAQYVTGWGYWDQGLRFSFITGSIGDCTQRLPILLKEGDSLTLSDGTTFPGNADPGGTLTSSIVLNRNGAPRVLFDLGPNDLLTTIRPAVDTSGHTIDMSGGTIHRVEVTFATQITVNAVFLDDAATLQAEAHRHSYGDLSVRITVHSAGMNPVTQLQVTGTGVNTTINVTGTGWQVVERTIVPNLAGATSLTINALAADGSTVGTTTATIS